MPLLPNYDGSGGLAAAIGITTGTVFCGEAGSELRREYTINGGLMASRPDQRALPYGYAANVAPHPRHHPTRVITPPVIAPPDASSRLPMTPPDDASG